MRPKASSLHHAILKILKSYNLLRNNTFFIYWAWEELLLDNVSNLKQKVKYSKN